MSKQRSSEAYSFTVKDYKKVLGAFSSGGTDLSLAFDNGKKILLRSFENRNSTGVPPNRRLLFFEKPLEMELISGVVERNGNMSEDLISVYLLLEK